MLTRSRVKKNPAVDIAGDGMEATMENDPLPFLEEDKSYTKAELIPIFLAFFSTLQTRTPTGAPSETPAASNQLEQESTTARTERQRRETQASAHGTSQLQAVRPSSKGTGGEAAGSRTESPTRRSANGPARWPAEDHVYQVTRPFEGEPFGNPSDSGRGPFNSKCSGNSDARVREECLVDVTAPPHAAREVPYSDYVPPVLDRHSRVPVSHRQFNDADNTPRVPSFSAGPSSPPDQWFNHPHFSFAGREDQDVEQFLREKEGHAARQRWSEGGLYAYVLNSLRDEAQRIASVRFHRCYSDLRRILLEEYTGWKQRDRTLTRFRNSFHARGESVADFIHDQHRMWKSIYPGGNEEWAMREILEKLDYRIQQALDPFMPDMRSMDHFIRTAVAVESGIQRRMNSRKQRQPGNGPRGTFSRGQDRSPEKRGLQQ